VRRNTGAKATRSKAERRVGAAAEREGIEGWAEETTRQRVIEAGTQAEKQGQQGQTVETAHETTDNEHSNLGKR
jgi:hypothetical protein